MQCNATEKSNSTKRPRNAAQQKWEPGVNLCLAHNARSLMHRQSLHTASNSKFNLVHTLQSRAQYGVCQGVYRRTHKHTHTYTECKDTLMMRYNILMEKQVLQPILVPHLSWNQTHTHTRAHTCTISLILASHEWVCSYRVGHINDSNLSTCPTWLLIPSTQSLSLSLSIALSTASLLALSTSVFVVSIIFYTSVIPQKSSSGPSHWCHFTFDLCMHSTSEAIFLSLSLYCRFVLYISRHRSLRRISFSII